jgi:hypothetical protein
VLTVVLLYNVQIDTVFVINEAGFKGFLEHFFKWMSCQKLVKANEPN